VVTKLPEPGAILEAGQVLMEVDGRPVFILTGELPLWRTVGPGVIGPDVAALRAALDALGIDAGQEGRNAYDDALSAGIAELFSHGDYDPPAALAAEDEAYQTALDAVEMAERSLTDAQLALTEAEKAEPTDLTIMQADNAVASARRALKAARTGDAGEAVASAQYELKLAKAQRDDLLAPRDTTEEQTALSDAQAQLTRAQGELAATPTDDPEARRMAEDSVAAAQTMVASAQRALDKAKLGPTDLDKMQAERAVTVAEDALAKAKVGDMGEALRSAEEQLTVAKAERKALNEPLDTSAQSLTVTNAQEDLAKARETLAEAGLNTVSPRDILMVGAESIRVDSVKAQLGLAADGAVIGWTETVLYGRVDLTEAQRSRVSTGSPVTVTLPSGNELPGVIGDITNATTNPQTFEMIPARARIDIEDQAALADIGLATVTVSLIENETEDTLVVPVTALMALAEGGYCVELEDGTLVPVEVGLIADTRAEIRSSALTEGLSVVIP
jgi:hypothetical protein